jgi:hypothetical protein
MPEFLTWLSQMTQIVLSYIAAFFGVIDSVPRWLWVSGWILAMMQTRQAKGAGRRMYSKVKMAKVRIVNR